MKARGLAMPMSTVVLMLLAIVVTGCATYQAYEGSRLPRDEVAVIEGTAKVRTMLPVAIVIRSVDGQEVGIQYASVSVAAGKHQLLVDCQVSGEFGKTTRHALDVEVEGGGRYRLTPVMERGNSACQSVNLQPL